MRALALACCVLALPAAASIARALTVEDLARRADAVVVGRVESLAPFWSRDHRRILTRVTVRVTARWKGSAPDELTLLRLGGELDGIGQRVLGEPRFVPGEEVVLFLRARGGVYQTIGLSQGAFRVEGGRAVQDLAGLALAREQGGQLAIGGHGEGALALGLDELRARVAAVVR